jgi:hypothetical protein
MLPQLHLSELAPQQTPSPTAKFTTPLLVLSQHALLALQDGPHQPPQVAQHVLDAHHSVFHAHNGQFQLDLSGQVPLGLHVEQMPLHAHQELPQQPS